MGRQEESRGAAPEAHAARAVFLDKDGTLLENVPYSVDPATMRLLPGVAQGLRLLHAAGYRLIVISNQSGVARGYFPADALAAVEHRLEEMLREWGVCLSGFYYCPHHPEGSVPAYAVACACRKPEPGLVLRAAQDHRIDLAASWFVGDTPADVTAGRRAGCRTVLVGPAQRLAPDLRPDGMVPDLAAAARLILARTAA